MRCMPMAFIGDWAVLSHMTCLKIHLKNAEMVVYWASDPYASWGTYCGGESQIWRLWTREAGIKQVFIDPFCNYTAATIGDKWIAPKVGTDSALALAIAYVWLNDDTYDKKYLETHTIGFEQFRDYVLGKEDKNPRRRSGPKDMWCSGTAYYSISQGMGIKEDGALLWSAGWVWWCIRLAYGHEWARLAVFLQAMQGLGKPGVSLWGSGMGAPFNANFFFPGYADADGKLPTTGAANKKIIILCSSGFIVYCSLKQF